MWRDMNDRDKYYQQNLKSINNRSLTQYHSRENKNPQQEKMDWVHLRQERL